MSEIAAISGTIGSIKALFDLSKSIVGIRDVNIIQGKVAELQSQILTAQSDAMAAQREQAAMLERVDLLKKEVAELKAWDAEKARYELHKLPAGGLVYCVKEEARGSEPSHCICASCYQKGQKAILQPIHHHIARSTSLDCPNCGTRSYEIGVSHPGHNPPIRSRA